MDSRGFLGRGWKFPPQIDPRTGHFTMSSHEENIDESIRIILQTYLGERVMRPDFGTDAINYVFASSRDFAQQSLAYELQKALTIEEPRVVDVIVRSDEADMVSGAMLIHITYTVRSTNNRYSMVYPFYLKGDSTEV